MPKTDVASAPISTGSRYPSLHNAPCLARSAIRLSDAAGLTRFGANLRLQGR